jgi:hypothetical protein
MHGIANSYFATFFTPRAMIWNIRTLGFSCWVKCLALNMRLAIAEQRRGFAGMDRSLP